MARKILLADDSVTAQNMGRKILTDAGYDVITVNNGSAALKRVTEQKPDLVVLDVYMPGYSGLEVCARLKDSQETARIPILLTVGKLEPFKPEEATRVKADAFIVKPFEASELLSALTRLEDRMVPPQAEGARFSNSVSGIERFSGDPMVKRSGSGDESDAGWKNRLRFPSKKKKEETEPEAEPDFVTPPSFRDYRRGGGKAPAASAAFPVNAAPAAGQEPGLVPDIPRDITPDELDALSALVAKLDGPIPESENVAPLGEKIGPVEAAATEATKHGAEAAPADVDVKEAEVVPAAEEAQSKAEGRAASAALAEATLAAALAESAMNAVEAPKVEAAAPAVVPVETASMAQAPAPVDRNDEPMFVATASAVPPASEEEKHEVQATASSEPSAAVEAPKPEIGARAEEPKVEEAPKAEEIPQAAPVTARAKETGEAEVPAPSAEELAEALRLLTPSQVSGQTLAEAGAALAQELSRGAAGGNRWVAEAVALSSEEASVSLEAEMFRTFATAPGGDGNSEATSAAVDRKAEERAEASVSAAEAKTEVRNEAAPAEGSHVAPAASAAEKTDRERRDARAKQKEEEPEEVGATTFADAVHRQEAEMVAASPENVSRAATGSAAQEEVPSSEDGSGGQEAMGKEAKGKGGKSNWHQIRSGAPAAATDAVEAAKQAEEAPKAMAATASADGATDAGAIASIVDSVLADLRPKIVEEIAKKLAKK